jgi:putative transposase
MAEPKRMTADEVVSHLLEGEGLDFLRESLAWVAQQLMEAEVTELIGADHGERTPERLTQRNGYRARPWHTRAGELELAIPKLRRGSYFPSFLEPRRRSEQALVAVIQEAYVAGVSTRKVDQVVESLGLRISKSEVSRICAGLDEQVDAFRERPLGGRYPYLWLDAKVEKVATAAASSGSVSCSPTAYTSRATARWSRSTWARPRRRPFGGASCAGSSSVVSRACSSSSPMRTPD